MSGRALSAASWGLAFAVFFLVQRTAFAAPPTTPGNLRFSEGAASAGYLTVSGTNLVFNGQTVLLRGENFNNGPALFSGMGTINTVQHDYELAHNMGLNHVRFGLAYNWYGTTASEHANFFAMIRNHVAWAKANHLWLIPVMFAAPGDPQAHAFSMSDEYGTQDSNFWSVPANRDLLTAFWKDFAGQFANEPAIAGYDIINEPGPSSMTIYTTWVQATYNQITAADPNHFVVVESIAPNGGPNGSLPNIEGRILWSGHCYGTAGGDCTFAGTSSSSPSKWPFWIGEMGATGNPGSGTGTVPGNLSYYNQRGISWCHFVMHWGPGGYGLYQSWNGGDFSSPWTEMISAVKNAAPTAGTVYP